MGESSGDNSKRAILYQLAEMLKVDLKNDSRCAIATPRNPAFSETSNKNLSSEVFEHDHGGGESAEISSNRFGVGFDVYNLIPGYPDYVGSPEGAVLKIMPYIIETSGNKRRVRGEIYMDAKGRISTYERTVPRDEIRHS